MTSGKESPRFLKPQRETDENIGISGAVRRQRRGQRRAEGTHRAGGAEQAKPQQHHQIQPAQRTRRKKKQLNDFHAHAQRITGHAEAAQAAGGDDNQQKRADDIRADGTLP